jgi:hypothetical protein
MSPFDPGLAGVASDYVRSWLTHPIRALGRAHFQSIMIIQPVDVLPDGRQNMCDSCPDVTVFDDRLVWSCRLEEPLQYGEFLRTQPKKN